MTIVSGRQVRPEAASNPQSGFYSTANAGMVGLARNQALEVARQGITVNAVLPGGS